MRNRVLDAAKASAAYFVILLHIHFPGTAGDIVNALARFAVPLFFMVSGYFCYSEKGDICKKLPGKFGHILQLTMGSLFFYIIWGCVRRSLRGEDSFQWLKSLLQQKYVKEFILYNNTSPVKFHLWFLAALLYCYLIFLAVEHFQLQIVAGILIPLLLAGNFYFGEGAAWRGTAFRTMIYRNWLFTGMPFFMMGYWIHRWEPGIGKKIRTGYLYPGMLCGMILTIMEYYRAGKQELFMGSVIFVLCLFMWCISDRDRVVPEWLADMGRKDAFLIYLLHPAVWDICKDTAGFLGAGSEPWFVWSAPVLVCILTGIMAECVRFTVLFYKNVI